MARSSTTPHRGLARAHLVHERPCRLLLVLSMVAVGRVPHCQRTQVTAHLRAERPCVGAHVPSQDSLSASELSRDHERVAAAGRWSGLHPSVALGGGAGRGVTHGNRRQFHVFRGKLGLARDVEHHATKGVVLVVTHVTHKPLMHNCSGQHPSTKWLVHLVAQTGWFG